MQQTKLDIPMTHLGAEKGGREGDDVCVVGVGVNLKGNVLCKDDDCEMVLLSSFASQ